MTARGFNIGVCMREYKVDKRDEGKRCDAFLFQQLPQAPASFIYKAFRKRSVRVNGSRVNQSHSLAYGDQVQIFIPEAYLENEAPQETEEAKRSAGSGIPLVVFSDENVLIVSKPQGMPVHDDKNREERVLDRLVQSLDSESSDFKGQDPLFPALCHRIDRNTGGLVVFARTQEALTLLSEKFKLHEMRKYYLCCVSGCPQKSERTLEAYLEKDSRESRVYIHEHPVRNSEKIITRYRLLSTNGRFSLLEVELVTGKTHQIRAHLAYIGHPLLGDGKYGSNSVNRGLGLKWQALWSYRLIFDFTSPSGSLDYLKGLTLTLPSLTWEKGLAGTGLDLPVFPPK